MERVGRLLGSEQSESYSRLLLGFGLRTLASFYVLYHFMHSQTVIEDGGLRPFIYVNLSVSPCFASYPSLSPMR